MTPSELLLTICLSVFAILTLIFSIFLIQAFLKVRKRIVESSTSTITQFPAAEKRSDKSMGELMSQYRFAKAK